MRGRPPFPMSTLHQNPRFHSWRKQDSFLAAMLKALGWRFSPSNVALPDLSVDIRRGVMSPSHASHGSWAGSRATENVFSATSFIHQFGSPWQKRPWAKEQPPLPSLPWLQVMLTDAAHPTHTVDEFLPPEHMIHVLTHALGKNTLFF